MKISFTLPTHLHPAANKWPLSYPFHGATKGDFPAGYKHDYNEIFIGSDPGLWESAKTEMRNWRHYPPEWTRVKATQNQIIPGETVGVYFHLIGFWVSNFCRIIYLKNEPDEWGFAYGTLTEHVESGEEYFYLRREASGKIYYGIKAFSKPQKWFVWLGYPIARFFQRRFVKQSLAIMKKFGKAYNSDKG